MISLVDYLNTGSSKLDGWLYAMDSYLFVLIDKAQKTMGIRGDLCEVGVYQGKSLILLALLAESSERIHGFDLFDPAIGSCAIEMTKKNLLDYLGNRVVNLYRKNSQHETIESLRAVLQSPLRFLHIDGGHEYAEVKHDLLLFSHFMDNGGVIALDDFNDREYPGIEAVVYEYVSPLNGARTHVPFLIGANKVFLCRPSQVKPFQIQIISHADEKLRFRLANVFDFRVLISESKQKMPRATILNSLRRS